MIILKDSGDMMQIFKLRVKPMTLFCDLDIESAIQVMGSAQRLTERKILNV